MKNFCLGLAAEGLQIPVGQAIDMIAEVGFDSTFFGYTDSPLLFENAEHAVKKGLTVTSLHAPFHKIDRMWYAGEEGDELLRRQLACVDACCALSVPIAVVHPWIGFDNLDMQPTEIGLSRFRQLADRAEEAGVRIAFENVEGEALLRGLLNAFSSHPAVGFCLDAGHELCYNRGRDLLAEFGDRLIYTHLNSNMGVTSPDGSIFWHDDSHMLPYDGLVNMDGLAVRLKKSGYRGPLTLELTRGNKGDRHTNDQYLAMTDEDYLANAFERLCRLKDAIIQA